MNTPNYPLIEDVTDNTIKLEHIESPNLTDLGGFLLLHAKTARLVINAYLSAERKRHISHQLLRHLRPGHDKEGAWFVWLSNSG